MNHKIANAQVRQSEDLDDCIEDVILERDLERGLDRLQIMIFKHRLIKERSKYDRYKPEPIK